tara:strand:+ start:270 stop:455 length:186 start_codon:yes stop_codon:yes gene_type:complete
MGRKDEFGNRTTKDTKRKEKQSRGIGSSKGTRVKLANIQRANNKNDYKKEDKKEDKKNDKK